MSKQQATAVDAHVGNRVRAARIQAGISQEQVADHLGLTFQQVQKYEKGINRIAAGRLFQIASLFGVTVEFFFDGLEPRKAVAPLREQSDEARIIARDFDALPLSARTTALSVIHAVLSGLRSVKAQAA